MKHPVFTITLLFFDLGIFLLFPILMDSPVGTKVFMHLNGVPNSQSVRSVSILNPVTKPPVFSARSVVLMDEDTGHVLLKYNADKEMPMASISKVMTAIVALHYMPQEKEITIGQDAVNEVTANQGSSANLVAGDVIQLKYLLYGLLLPSGDDAAVAIADSAKGSSAGFVKDMNDFAAMLGMTHTHYINPDGLTYLVNGKPADNYTTASELAHLVDYAMHDERFRQIAGKQHFQLPADAFHHSYSWDTTNLLLGDYAGATGVKTGYTPNAGYSLAFSAYNGSHHIIGVLLYDTDSDPASRFTDAKRLLDWAFSLPTIPS